MSPGELGWRLRSAVRDLTDRVRIPLGIIPSSVLSNDGLSDSDLRLSDVSPGEWREGRAAREGTWIARLLPRAERILAHRLSFFDLEDLELGDPVQWNFDHERRVATPVGVSQAIDYREYSVTGDCKIVWEPSRHHQAVVLGRAFRASGDPRFAGEAVAQIDSWIKQCPFGRGMHWRSPLELAVRAINWVWAYDLIRESNAFGGEAHARFLHSMYLHLWEVSRKFSRGSSANNHLIGEAAGVFIASTYFARLPNASRWRAESAAILERQIIAQSNEDGGGREQAFGYHGFVLQFFLVAAVVARRAGTDFSAAYWSRLERMLEFACRMLEGGPAPTFGDADDGYVLDLGAAPGNVRDLLAIGAALFKRADFKEVADGHEEAVRWLLGRDGLSCYDALPRSVPAPLEPYAFPETGYYLLQGGHKAAADRLSVLFDCGELGFTSIGAHGHADALSFTVRAFGRDLLVDSGTYDYFTYPAWRQYFRSTRAHNTISVDEADQSTMIGLFMWGQRANAQCTHWDPDPRCTSVAGQHDGFTRLPDPVTHTRRLELETAARTLTIRDELICAKGHDVRLFFHLADDCRADLLTPNRIAISSPGGRAELETDSALSIAFLHGRDEPGGGWISRGYHCRTRTTTIVASGKARGGTSYVCRLRMGDPQGRGSP